MYTFVWLRTNGVNTNGVTAKALFVDGFEQVLKMHVWDMTKCCMQSSPSRRNNNRGSQPMRTMLGKQRCMPYACARWFPCVRRCMDMYGYMSMDECLHTQSQTRAHTYMWQILTDFDGLGRMYPGMPIRRYKFWRDGFDRKELLFDGFWRISHIFWRKGTICWRIYEKCYQGTYVPWKCYQGTYVPPLS